MDHKRQGTNDMTLGDLLDNCTNPNSPVWEKSWQEFLNRYQNFIYKLVLNRCKSWNLQRIKYQLQDEVDDIVFIVIKHLIKDDYRFLKQFQNRDNPQLFLLYLSTLINRITRRHLAIHFNKILDTLEEDQAKDTLKELSPEAGWEIYEELVQSLRNSMINKHPNNERNIHLFLMYTWTDMSIDMLTHNDFYKPMGQNAIYTLINRMRNKIKV